MPSLPTLEVTDEQAQRMLAAYGSADEYTDWLKRSIVDFVLNYESRQRRIAFEQQDREMMAQARVDLLGPDA